MCMGNVYGVEIHLRTFSEVKVLQLSYYRKTWSLCMLSFRDFAVSDSAVFWAV